MSASVISLYPSASSGSKLAANESRKTRSFRSACAFGFSMRSSDSVSYTHLTLPTIYSV